MKTLLLLSVFLFVSACDAGQKSEGAINHKSPTVAYLKPGAAAELSYSWLQKPGVGSPGKLELTVISRSPDATLDIELNTDSGLQLAGGSKQASYHWQKGHGGPMVQTLDVTPSSEGLHYLNVIIHSTIEGETRARAFAIPVQVGAVSEKAMQHPYLVEQQDGSKIIELPAEER
ncbi:hypothetical protein [Permianibacter aggregans]|uniref:Uncharacterized protein n=1 Tax=Permianibacter aggregans TaxID=1510150 RepID=A0A4R6UTK6_9GAMM|nr:hypothetical protein [Permianibacter aggregans]QGX40142.1 hypothetical protein E2H98_10855 [Permianibacter aggregans]TDQ49043.1 hypothetical protein EV696_10517 [Permianibacter aggregans]